MLPGLANCFKVTFRFVSAQGQDLGDASKAVVLTQLVLDDGVVVQWDAGSAWLARGSSRFQAPGSLIKYGLGNAVFS